MVEPETSHLEIELLLQNSVRKISKITYTMKTFDEHTKNRR